MTSLLVACGQALYGERWHAPLARDLGVSDRTMRRWAAGQFPVPEGVGADLLKLCEARAVKLGQLAKKLEAR